MISAPARFFSAFIVVVAIAFGLLLLLTVAQQPSTSRIMVLCTEMVAAATIFGALLLVVCVPWYTYVMNLRWRIERLEKNQDIFMKQDSPAQQELAFMQEGYVDQRPEDTHTAPS